MQNTSTILTKNFKKPKRYGSAYLINFYDNFATL